MTRTRTPSNSSLDAFDAAHAGDDARGKSLRGCGGWLRGFFAAAALLSMLCTGPVSLLGQESTLDFRRTFVPRAEVEKVGAGFVPLPRDKFEATVARLREAPSAVEPARTRLTSAVWIGIFDGENVSGIARWTPAKSGSTSTEAIAVLGTTNLFLDPSFATDNVPTIPDFAVAAIEAHGDAAALASDTNRPRLFLRADGLLGGEFPQGLPATTAWSARTEATDAGTRIAEWRLPQSLRTTLWLAVPPGVQVSTDSDWLVERVAEEEAGGEVAPSAIYRLQGHPLAEETLKLRFASVSEPTPEEFLYRVANRYVRSLQGLDVEYDVTLDCRAGEFDQVRLLLPNSVSPIEALYGETRLDLVRSEAPLDASGSVEWVAELPAAIAPSVSELKLRGIAQFEATGDTPLPQVRVAGATWAGESSVVVAEPPLEIQGIVCDDCVPAAGTDSGGSGGEKYRHRNERSTVAARFGRPPGRGAVESVLSLRAGRSSLEASLFAEISASEGPIFEQQLRLLGPWSLDRIEVEPAGALLDWSIDERRTIRLRFRDGILPGQSVRVGCEAHLRVDDPNSVRSGETLRVFEFVENVQENRAIALFDDASFRFRPVRIDDWRTLTRTDLSAAQRASLGSTAPRAILKDDATFRAMEFAFETEESRLDVRSTTSLERSGASVAGRIQIECLSLSAPIDRLLVVFSSPLPPGSRWSSPDAEDVPFDAQRIGDAPATPDGGETWELTFARPVATPFEILAAYELLEENSLAAPLASAPAALSQTGRLSIEADLLAEREATGVGLERVPTADDPDEPEAIRFRYDPARRHGASLEPAPGGGLPSLSLSAPVALSTEISSAGLHHLAIYRAQASSPSMPAKLRIAAPPGALLNEVRAIGEQEETASVPGAKGVVELAAPSGLHTIEVRFFQPLPALALWSEQNVSLSQIENLHADVIEWRVDPRGAVAFAVEADGWRGAEDDDATGADGSASGEASSEPATGDSFGGRAFVALSADRPLKLDVYRTDLILQAAWVAFFATAAFVWALASRSPAASAVVIATLAAALAFLPEQAEALRWGALYGAAAGLVCCASFRKFRIAASSSEEPLDGKRGDGKRGLATASVLATLALASTVALSAFAQEVAAPKSEARTYRVLIPTDDAGLPTGAYYYASREFYDRFLAVERELARPAEEWRIVDAAYEGTMSPGLIDGMPRLSQLTLQLEIETFADDVVATLPLNRRYAEFAGMMEDAGAGSVEVEWNETGDALSLRFEQKGRRELAIPFYPLVVPDLPGGARSVKILPIPWAKLFVTGPADALDDLSVTGALGAGERRPNRENVEIDLGQARELTFSSRRAASSASAGPALRWTAGLILSGDPAACRIDARVTGEAPLGVLVSRSTVEVGPGWTVDAASAPGASYRIEPVASKTPGHRRFDVVFDEPRAGEIVFDFGLLPESSQEAGLFRTPRLTIDGLVPAATFATMDKKFAVNAEWTPVAPGRAATAREVPAALELSVAEDLVRLAPPGESANFVVLDSIAPRFYAVQAEFFVSPADVSVRYEIAMPAGTERWQEIDLPEAIEVADVYRAPANSRTPLLWRRDARRLFVKMPTSGAAPEPPAPIVIDASLRGLRDGSASLATPTLRRASLSQIDLRVYRRAGLDVSIEAGPGFQVNPSFVPGAYIEGKGRGVGAFLSVKSAEASNGVAPAPPALRSRPAAPGKATLWTSVASQDLRQTARFDIEVDPGSGLIDRLATEAPATLGAPEVVSPAGTLTVRESANPDRRYWIFVPLQPLGPGASVTLSAPLDPAAAGRPALRPIRLLNVATSDRFVLLPNRLEDEEVAWSVTRLQPARDDDRIGRRIAALGGDAIAFEAPDETFSARARRVDPQTATPLAIHWTERRLRFEAPGEYRAVVAWDVSPQEHATLEIGMPAGTTPTALDVDGIPCRWTPTANGIRATLLPTALPFRLALAYRGAVAAEKGSAESDGATLTLASPVLGDGVSRADAWIVEASSAAPRSIVANEASDRTSLDYVAARLAAFESTFAAAASRTDGFAPEETRSFAQMRLGDLTALQRLAQAEPASAKRDEALARIEASMKPYRETLRQFATASKSDAGLLRDAASANDPPFEPGGAKLLAMRLGDGANLSMIDLAVTSRAETRKIPWRSIAETSAIVLLCLVVAFFGRTLLRWFEQMPLPVGTLAFVALAPLFVPAGWIAPAMALAFVAFALVAARRWLLPLLPARGRRAPAP